jgi:hypothetical protein
MTSLRAVQADYKPAAAHVVQQEPALIMPTLKADGSYDWRGVPHTVESADVYELVRKDSNSRLARGELTHAGKEAHRIVHGEGAPTRVYYSAATGQAIDANGVPLPKAQAKRQYAAALASARSGTQYAQRVPVETAQVAYRTSYEKPATSTSGSALLSRSFSNIGSGVVSALTESAEPNPYVQDPYLFDGTQQGAISANLTSALTSGSSAEGGRMGGFNFASDANTSVIGYTVPVANDWHATGFVRASTSFESDPNSQYASLGNAGTLSSSLGGGFGISHTFERNNVSGAVSLIGGVNQVTSASVVDVGGGQFAATGGVKQELNPTVWFGAHLKF